MAVVPDFLAGALAVPITGARHIGLDTFGLALSGFFVLPVTVATARSCGRLAAAVARRGGKPRRRQIDLAIAATAQVEGVPLMTRNLADFEMVDKAPARGDASLVSSSCPRRRRPVRVEGGSANLAARLPKAAVEQVEVVGLAADVCVSATARDARRLGYEVSVDLAASAFVHAHPDGGRGRRDRAASRRRDRGR